MTITVSYLFLHIERKLSTSMAKLQRSMPASGSSKIARSTFRAMSVAISTRFTSPPESDASTSRFRYSREQSPTLVRYAQHASSGSSLPWARLRSLRTVSPLKRGGCWNA